VRENPWDPLPVKVAAVFGTRVAENHLGQRSTNRTNRPDIWMQAIRSDHQKTLAHGGRPHMGPGGRRDDARAALHNDTRDEILVAKSGPVLLI